MDKACLTDQDRLDWLRLIRSDNVGPRTFRALLAHCGSAAAALDDLPRLARRGGAAHPVRLCPVDAARREMEAIQARGLHLVALPDRSYPAGLRVIDDAPPLLTVRGELAALNQPTVAIVGSRNASGAGRKMAQRLARDLGSAGFIIASGLARGIDAAAHEGSLATGTIAVLAGGHDRIYPAEHAPLVDAISAAGAAVSEMPLTLEPRARDFPRRNRLISGLALGIIVVEAARRSGSLITARLALEQGREVFAVPGSPLDPRAEGTNDLLRQGATLATEAADIIGVLRPVIGSPVAPQLVDEDEPDEPGPQPTTAGDDDRSRIAGLLGPTPVAIDDLVRLSASAPATVRTVLLELDLAGRLQHHGAARVSLA